MLHMTAFNALPFALLTAGFLYFPLRQLAARKLVYVKADLTETTLARFVTDMTNARTQPEFQHRWEETLTSLFRPSKISRLALNDNKQATLKLSDSGSGMLIPGAKNFPALIINGKNNNSRLFNSKDISTVKSLIKIRDVSRNAQQLRETAIQDERERIMIDLHDTLGARLLTLIHQAPDDTIAESARSSLETLRETVRYSTARDKIDLTELLADLKAESSERTENYSTAIEWLQSNQWPKRYVNAAQAVCISNALRECISNALKHSNTTLIRIRIDYQKGALCIAVQNSVNAKNINQQQKGKGTGLTGLLKRLNALGGTLSARVQQEERGQAVYYVDISLPIEINI